MVFVDVGRWTNLPGMATLLRAATVVAVVLRPTVDGVEHARHLVEPLRAAARQVRLLCVGDKPYDPADVGAALGVDVLGTLALDAAGVAQLLTAGAVGKRWKRSEFARSAHMLVGVLAAVEGSAAPVWPAGSYPEIDEELAP